MDMHEIKENREVDAKNAIDSFIKLAVLAIGHFF